MTTRALLRPALALVFALSGLVSSKANAAEPPVPIPLALYEGKQFTVQAVVGGKERIFLFDTGEGTTMISPQVAADLGCKPWGNEVGFRMLGERFEAPRCDDITLNLGGSRWPLRTAFVYDLSKILGPESPPLDGAVGLDLFDRQVLTLDFTDRALILETPESLTPRIAHATAVPLRVTRYANGGIDIFIGVQTAGGTAWMTLDSGNGGPTVFVAPIVAPLLGLNAHTREPQPVELPITDGLVFKGKARVFPNMIMDGNIGMQLMRGHALTLDLAHDRAWIAPAASNEKPITPAAPARTRAR